MKRLSILVFMLVIFVGCANTTNENNNVPPGIVVKYDGYLDNFFGNCKTDISSGTGTGNIIVLNEHQSKVEGFDFKNNKELNENSTNIISTVKFSGKKMQTLSGTDSDFYYTVGTAKIAKYNNANKCVVVSNNLMRNVYNEKAAEDKPYYVSVADLNSDGMDEILVSVTYNKPQYKVHICNLFDGKTLDEIEFLDKQMFVKAKDKQKLIDYLDTNTSELSQWFKNVLQITEKEYTGNVVMNLNFVKIEGENCIALQFEDYYNYALGQVIVVYGFEKEGIVLKQIYLCTEN